MKLLLDENLSDRIINRIIDLYPDSEHVKTLAMTNTDDAVIWEYAKTNDFVIVSKDSDFHQRSLVYGHPLTAISFVPTQRAISAIATNYKTLRILGMLSIASRFLISANA